MSPLYFASHMMVWELPAPPRWRTAAWPMAGRDARHTNAY